MAHGTRNKQDGLKGTKTKKQPPARRRRKRDDFGAAVLKEIAHEVGHRCSNPDCQAPTSGPSKQKKVSNIGAGAHITAAAAGGPRFDPSMTPIVRASATNALWLCNSCGRLIDNDDGTYTVAQLAQWKLDAIGRAQKALASGGRSTTEGLFAAQLEVQKQALAHERESHAAQMREQERATFSQVYTAFLQQAKAYADAIDVYSTWMLRNAYAPDRPDARGDAEAHRRRTGCHGPCPTADPPWRR